MTPIVIDFPPTPRVRYTQDEPHELLLRLLSAKDSEYKATLEVMAEYKVPISKIKESKDPRDPKWYNGYFTGSDAIALYGMLTFHEPSIFFEIGSGNSTKFARRAILDQKLKTKIVSLDPSPRQEIDDLCDQVERDSLENVHPSTFDALEAGDFLFIDSSHRCFQNSDVTAFYLDVLPRLKPGIFVHIHDVFLPYDYPDVWLDRYYSEQYLLAAILLGQQTLEPVLPLVYCQCMPDLNQILASSFSFITNVFHSNAMKTGGYHGTSAWFITL